MDQVEFPLSDREFARIKARVYDAAGISLSDAKRTLVVARLTKIVRTQKFGSFDAYLDHLERGGAAEEAQDFVNALTTNLTRFWREEHHFAHLAQYVGGLIEANNDTRGKRRLRIWSAGCSTGQEPYTIALTLRAAWPQLKSWDFKILATDIDTSVVARAATGIYPATELNGLEPERAAMFEKLPDGRVRVPPAVASLITFKPLNLLAPLPVKGPFDAIFCRNVTIYFDKQTQTTVFGKLASLLGRGGMLYIGHAENLGAQSSNFRLMGKTTYQARTDKLARDAA